MFSPDADIRNADWIKEAERGDADIHNADWPKRTPDRMGDLRNEHRINGHRITIEREATPLNEPPIPENIEIKARVLIREEDGRVWVVESGLIETEKLDDDEGRWVTIRGNPVFIDDSEKSAKQSKKLTRSGKLPPIAEGVGASLIRIELENAELPDAHLDGVSIRFIEGEYPTSNIFGRITEAYGMYNTRERSITLAVNAKSRVNEFANRLGTGNIHVFGGATVLHEIGHHVHLAKLTDKAADDWAKYSENGKAARISSYAQTNQGEHFAEAYREYARGNHHRARLKNTEPLAYKFMASVFRRADMFRDDYAPEDQFDRRYGG